MISNHFKVKKTSNEAAGTYIAVMHFGHGDADFETTTRHVFKNGNDLYQFVAILNVIDEIIGDRLDGPDITKIADAIGIDAEQVDEFISNVYIRDKTCDLYRADYIGLNLYYVDEEYGTVEIVVDDEHKSAIDVASQEIGRIFGAS